MAEQPPKEIRRDDVRLIMRRGGQLIDVLPRQEYDRIHIAGATSVPLQGFDRTLADRLQWDKPVIVYAQDYLDDQSARAAWRLASMGFTQVYRYTPGKTDWLANGLPAEGKDVGIKAAGDLADMDALTCRRDERIEALRKRVQEEGQTECVVTNDQEVVLGLVRANAFEKANPNWTAEEAMERNPQTYRLDAPVEAVREYFQANPWVDSVLVTSTDGVFFGLIHKEDAVSS
jgi:rhodanese-related sulfurtransferase